MGSRPLDETELIIRAKNGESAAYGELVRSYERLAFRTAYLITRSSADAQEAAQEGFVKAYYAIDRFRLEAPFRPWLLRIVANEARNRRKAEQRRAGLVLRLQGRSSEGAAPSPESVALARESREALLRAVDSLREEERLVITCKYFLELTEDETAQVLGVRKGTVKSRTSRALERLRSSMPELNEEAKI